MHLLSAKIYNKILLHCMQEHCNIFIDLIFDNIVSTNIFFTRQFSTLLKNDGFIILLKVFESNP